MSKITRFGVSMEEQLQKDFDALIERKGYPNRSEAIRDIVRETLMKEELQNPEHLGTGTVNIVFDHHRPQLSDKLTTIQHDSVLHISSTTHIHLSKHHCLEIIVVSGTLEEIRNFGDKLAAQKGVLHAQTFLFSTEKM